VMRKKLLWSKEKMWSEAQKLCTSGSAGQKGTEE
jgi:hypothetical protein